MLKGLRGPTVTRADAHQSRSDLYALDATTLYTKTLACFIYRGRKHRWGTVTKGALRRPELSNILVYMGGIPSFLANADETGGRFTMLQFVSRQGSEPPAHVHQNEHEFMQIMEGEIEFFIEGVDAGILAKPGDTIYLPKERAHALVFRTPTVRAKAILFAVEGHHTAEAFLKAMASGPAQMMTCQRSLQSTVRWTPST